MWWNVITVVIGGVLLFIVFAFWVPTLEEPRLNPPPSEEGGLVACTADAKMCPDGSYVGRVGPNCEFAPCPGTI